MATNSRLAAPKLRGSAYRPRTEKLEEAMRNRTHPSAPAPGQPLFLRLWQACVEKWRGTLRAGRHATSTRSGASSLAHFWFCLALRIDRTLEICPVFNNDALCQYVARHDSRSTQLHSLTGVNVALNTSLDNHLTGVQMRVDAAIGTYGQAVVVEIDCALDLPVQVQVLASRQLSFDYDRLANVRDEFAARVKLVRFHGTGLLVSEHRRDNRAACRSRLRGLLLAFLVFAETPHFPALNLLPPPEFPAGSLQISEL